MLSWRSPAHPQAGGAEVVTDEVLRRMAADGYEITWFSGAYPGLAAEEVVGGVRHIRRGAQWSVHAHAWRWLRTRLEQFDRVVDQVNTIPFLTPLYVPADKRRLFIHQLAREYWWRETRGAFRAVAPFGYAAEPVYMRAYRSTRTLTVSESTRADLLRLGLRDIVVVPQLVDIEAVDQLDAKPPGLSVVMVSRLTPAKFFEEGVLAFAAVQARVPEARLEIVGDGDLAYRERLQALVARLGLHDVTFHGRVPMDRRRELVRGAHVHLFTSHREGWGLVVSEAGADGTPSVAYDAPGVRDSVADPELLAPIGDATGLAKRVLALTGDSDRYERARRAAWERARAMSPERTAKAFEAALQ